MKFHERLQIKLKLCRLGKAFTVPAGNVRVCSLELERSGFRASVEFVLRDDSPQGGRFKDELAPVFLTSDELSIELSLVPEHPAAQSQSTQTPLRVRGLVVQRSLEEIATDWSAKNPLFLRRYRVDFTDPARARWSKHFPVELYTKRSLLAALKEQTAAAFELSSTWDEATKELPQLFLHLPREGRLSLYEFVAWYADSYGGCLLYDYQTGKYSLAADESSNEKPVDLFGDDVGRALFRLRERDPAQPRVLNSYAPSPATVSPQADGVLSGLQSDFPIREAVLAEQSTREQRENARRDLGGVETEMVLRAFSAAVVAPGGNLMCKQGQRFAVGSRLIEESLRIDRLQLSAHAVRKEVDAEYGAKSVGLELELTLGLKQSSDVRPPRSESVPPRYPGFIEGLVVSQKGAQSDITWDMIQAEQTQVEEVVVNLPLFSQSVSVPFEPTFDSFNTFRPRCRGERVLVALGLHHSRIVRTLSFRPEAVLKADACGEQMVFGKSGKSITKMSHQYEGKEPIFDVTRIHDNDHIQMTFSEGKVLISVAEEGS